MKRSPRITILLLLTILATACSSGSAGTPAVTEVVIPVENAAPPTATSTIAAPQTSGAAPTGDRFRWERSLIFDPAASGQPLPISITQIVAHRGRLYAGSSTDGETGNYSQRSSYIFVKKSADSPWVLDADFGPYTEQVNFLLSARLENGPDGKPIPEGPVEILIAGTNQLRQAGRSPARLRVRDDQTEQWLTIDLPTAKPKDHSIRSAVVYRDRTLNVDLIVIAANPAPLGIYIGFYDPNMPGKLRWSDKPELVERPPEGEPEVRGADLIYSLAVVNGNLYAATGRGIYRRIDGLEPSWKKVLDLPPDPIQPDYEVRALTAVPNPKEITGWPEEEMLVFANAMGIWRMRCPEDSAAEHTRQSEIELINKTGEYTAQPVFMSFASNTPFTPYPNAVQPQFWLIGLQVVFAVPGMNPMVNDPQSTRYDPQAYFLIRDREGNYQFGQILDPADPERMLAMARTFALSPFPGEENVIYAGGFTAAMARGLLGTAWIYRGVLNP